MTQTAGTEAATTATDAATTTDAATATDTTDAGKQAEIDWKAKSREWERRAKANADAAAKLAQLEESQKTEAQKLADRAEAAERRAAEGELSQTRLRVALRHGIDETDVDRLRGSTEDELDADAKAFSERLKKTVRPSGSADQGTRGTAPSADPRQAMADFLSQNGLR